MLTDRTTIHFSLVTRACNQAADCLAALASREMGPTGLILESPTLLAHIIFREATGRETLKGQRVIEEDREGIG